MEDPSLVEVEPALDALERRSERLAQLRHAAKIPNLNVRIADL
jgi:hypothetical protein